MNESVIIAVVGAAIGWILRHVGVGANVGGTSPKVKQTAPASPAAGLTGGLKGEIEAIVADAVKTAVAVAISDLRAGVTAQAAPPAA